MKHFIKRIRGLLSAACNSGIGHFSDDTEHMERAIAYLRHPA